MFRNANSPLWLVICQLSFVGPWTVMNRGTEGSGQSERGPSLLLIAKWVKKRAMNPVDLAKLRKTATPRR